MSSSQFNPLIQVASVTLALLSSAAAYAQDNSMNNSGATAPTSNSSYNTSNSTNTSPQPYLHNGYVGFGLGNSRYNVDCGPSGRSCDNSDNAGQIYFGGFFSPNIGAEVGYVDFGTMNRGGGDTKARGLNLSLVGRLPLGDSRFSLLGKVGATYGHTTTDAPDGAGITTGSENSWGPAYGVGVSYDFTNNWSAVLDWQQTRFEFAGGNHNNVRSTDLGLKYSF